MEDHFEEFVRAESIDNGKPVALARAVDIPRAIANLRAFAAAATEDIPHRLADLVIERQLRKVETRRRYRERSAR